MNFISWLLIGELLFTYGTWNISYWYLQNWRLPWWDLAPLRATFMTGCVAVLSEYGAAKKRTLSDLTKFIVYLSVLTDGLAFGYQVVQPWNGVDVINWNNPVGEYVKLGMTAVIFLMDFFVMLCWANELELPQSSGHSCPASESPPASQSRTRTVYVTAPQTDTFGQPAVNSSSPISNQLIKFMCLFFSTSSQCCRYHSYRVHHSVASGFST